MESGKTIGQLSGSAGSSVLGSTSMELADADPVQLALLKMENRYRRNKPLRRAYTGLLGALFALFTTSFVAICLFGLHCVLGYSWTGPPECEYSAVQFSRAVATIFTSQNMIFFFLVVLVGFGNCRRVLYGLGLDGYAQAEFSLHSSVFTRFFLFWLPQYIFAGAFSFGGIIISTVWLSMVRDYLSR